MEDHTKLVWATEKRHPFPDFNFDCGPKPEVRFNPLTDLALELQKDESVYYSVRKVEKDCLVAVEGTGNAGFTVECGGETLGKMSLQPGDILHPLTSNSVMIPPMEDAVIKITVDEGVLTIKNVKFTYTD